MSEPFIGEIKIVAFNFPPRNWATCDGQLLSISQNQSLFSLVGTYYGGDGRTTFGLPDLRGRLPMHQGQGPGLSSRPIGQGGGAENSSLDVNNLPPHTHTASLACSGAEGDRSQPTDAFPARPEDPLMPYTGNDDGSTMNGGAITVNATGSGTSFSNLPPYRVLNFVIALAGLYPSRS